MSKVVKPDRSLSLEHVGRQQWRFVHRPLHAELSERLRKATELSNAGQLARAERVLRAMLLEAPDHLDALHQLALMKDRQGESAVAITIWEHAVRLGRRAFPDAFEWERDRVEWRYRENRGFLRCVYAYAAASRDEGETARSLALCRELLSLNPPDDQGVRAAVVDTLLELGRPAEVLAVCDEYPGDFLPELRYGLALALFQLGRRDQAYRALLAALARAPLSHRQARVWDTTAGAIEWLREVTVGTGRVVAGAGWSGPR